MQSAIIAKEHAVLSGIAQNSVHIYRPVLDVFAIKDILKLYRQNRISRLKFTSIDSKMDRSIHRRTEVGYHSTYGLRRKIDCQPAYRR